MAAGKRMTVDELEAARLQVHQMIADSKAADEPISRHRICKATGLTWRRVDAYAAEVGYSFDRRTPQLEAMWAARKIDTREARARVSQQVLDEISAVFERIHSAEHVVVGWHQGVAYEHVLSKPPPNDLKNYVITLGILIDKHLTLERYTTEDPETNTTLAQVQAITEVARLLKTHPDMSVEDIIREITRR